MMQATSTTDLLNYSRQELEAEMVSLGLETFRARQLVRWLYKFRKVDFGEMTDISKSVREQLAAEFVISRPSVEKRLASKDGSHKYVMTLADGSRVESVLICQNNLPNGRRYTLCISSQVGCAIGCKFCMTGTMGLTRHLSTAEIVGQVLAVQDDIQQRAVGEGDIDADRGLPKEWFQNIVFMGMGEPLHNLQNVIRAVTLLNDPLGFDFSGRKITVSTSGLVPAIKEFGDSAARANLAVSLNATTDETRTSLIPINKKWPLDVLLDALRNYPLKKGRRITMEYVMLKGINDSDEDLKRLPKLLRGIPSKVNLIPYNFNTGLGFEPPAESLVTRWQSQLNDRGLNATIRWSKGLDIDAACGQLVTNTLRKSRENGQDKSLAA